MRLFPATLAGIICTCCFLWTAVSFAQGTSSSSAGSGLASSQSTMSGSGSLTGSGRLTADILREAAMIHEKDRSKRTQELMTDVTGAKKREKTYKDILDRYYRQRATYRQACRQELHLASILTRTAVTIRCYKEDLASYREYLKKQREYLAAMMGITERSRKDALSRLDLLIDAVDTIIFATEKGVYLTSEEVLEAQKNLSDRYQKPFWAALNILRADRLLSWTSLLLTRIDDTITVERLSPAQASARWEALQLCLVEQESALHTILDGEAKDDSAALTMASDKLKLCLAMISALPAPPPPQTGSGSISSGSSSSF